MAVKDFNQGLGTFNTELVEEVTLPAAISEVAGLQAALDAKLTATQGAVVADIAASTNITAVPGAFADLAAVQTYLAGANMVPNIEARLDALEAKVNALLAALRAANIIAT